MSMDKTQIDTALNRLFHEQGKRIVFWNDPQREFEDALAALAVPDINVVRLAQEGALALKIRVELFQGLKTAALDEHEDLDKHQSLKFLDRLRLRRQRALRAMSKEDIRGQTAQHRFDVAGVVGEDEA